MSSLTLSRKLLLVISLAVTLITSSWSPAFAGGNTSDKTVSYDFYDGAIKATLFVKLVLVDVPKAFIATTIPSGSQAVAIEGYAENIIAAGILYGLGNKEAANNILAKTIFTTAVDKVLTSNLPVGSYITVAMTLDELAQEFKR